jgi:hypothetical protein
MEKRLSGSPTFPQEVKNTQNQTQNTTLGTRVNKRCNPAPENMSVSQECRKIDLNDTIFIQKTR